MEIKGKVHCLFEQSGTFKNEFIKLGIPAEDYDIEDRFGETDHIIDIFNEIERGYEGKESIFDNISKDDLIMSFFPCIKFCNFAEYNQKHKQKVLRKAGKPIRQIYDYLKKESDERYRMYQLCLKMHGVVEFNGLRMIMENPWNEINYTNHFWFMDVTFIDRDRTQRGDFFKKPTGYWFTNCEPTQGHTLDSTSSKDVKTIVSVPSSDKTGKCSIDRSMISSTYAKNFINDFIIGNPGCIHEQADLF